MSSDFPSEALPAGEARVAHATTVAVAGRGLMLIGPPGAGKSGLALTLMAFGAGLVSDDRTRLERPDAGAPLASAGPSIAGRIEARGVGILGCRPAPPTRLALVVDMGQTEAERLPPARTLRVLGADVRLLHKVESPHFAAALLAYLRDNSR